jgi:hypothetical protein
MGLEHQLSIFVFRWRATGVDYLLVRRHPLGESTWSPVRTRLRPEETLRRAARRRMREFCSAPEPTPWIDLNRFEHFEVGDLDLVRWGVGYGVEGGWEPDARRDRSIARLRWEPLPAGLHLLEEEDARRSLFHLHVRITGS